MRNLAWGISCQDTSINIVTANTLIQGAVKEEKLLFSGEESTTSEHGIHLESGLRVVQVLDLGESESDKERSIRASSTVESSKTGNDGKTQGEHLGKLSKDSRRRGSHKKHSRESSPKNIGWEDISDASDEGTPERDLPGKWPSTLSLSHKTWWLIA